MRYCKVDGLCEVSGRGFNMATLTVGIAFRVELRLGRLWLLEKGISPQ